MNDGRCANWVQEWFDGLGVAILGRRERRPLQEYEDRQRLRELVAILGRRERRPLP